MTNILLDTNAYRELFSGDQTPLNYIGESEVVYVPVIVIGELYAGFFGGSRFDLNKEILDTFLAKPNVKILKIGFETAQIYGEIKSELKIKGTPVPINDVWIAACAIEAGAILVTYDKHFLKISGLRVWRELKGY